MVTSNDNFVMRDPCKYCGNKDGYIQRKNGQDCCYCVSCGKHNYNVPRHERGLRPVELRKDYGISVSTEYKVIERANYRCEFCGADPQGNHELTFHMAHLLSVDDIKEFNFPPELVNHLDNLAWLCDRHNLGMGKTSLSTHQLLLWILRRINKDNVNR